MKTKFLVLVAGLTVVAALVGCKQHDSDSTQTITTNLASSTMPTNMVPTNNPAGMRQ